MVKIGIIGGSGLYNLDVENTQEIEVETKYGKPSSNLRTGLINNTEVVFLTRHGKEHTIPPTQVNFRANIQALKEIGCTHILATTACGSLKREIGRGHLVILDQFIDFTKHRKFTFYDEFKPGEHGHTPMATPFSKELRKLLISSCQELNLEHHEKGTVVTIEGPRFSTKAESKMFASWGADVINMSIAPEAALSNEAKIPYAAVAMSTDYDCLFEDITPVTHEEVLKVFNENVEKVIKLITRTIPKISGEKIEEEEEEEERIDLKQTIRTVLNWPKEGVMFRDITTLLKKPKAFNQVIDSFVKRYQNQPITKILGIESRGFIFGAVLAYKLKIPFIIARKPGKLPAETEKIEYQTEYSTDCLEIHKDAIEEGDKVLIIDDLIATGGTVRAVAELIEKLNGEVFECSFLIDLPDLKGTEKLSKYNVFKLINFEGE